MKVRVLLVSLALTLTLGLAKGKNGDNLHPLRGGVAAAIQPYFERTAPEPAEYHVRANHRMFMLLCTEYRAAVDCANIDTPKVELFRRNPLRPGLQGYYRGGDVIYVRSDLAGGRLEEVLAHEQSHYLDWVLGELRVPVARNDKEGIFQLCYSEKIAWGVSDYYHKNELWGNPRHVVGKRWVSWYKHCTPFRDRLYP